MSALNPDPANDQDQSDDSLSGEEEDTGMPQLGVIWTADDNDAAMEDADSDEEDVHGPCPGFMGIHGPCTGRVTIAQMGSKK